MTTFGNRLIRVDLAENGSLTYTDEEGDATERESSRKHQEVFQWTSTVGSLEINFPEGHPFDKDPSGAEAGQPTAPVRVQKQGKKGRYKYDVIVTEKNGVVHRDDPWIIVDQGMEFVDQGMEFAGQGTKFADQGTK